MRYLHRNIVNIVREVLILIWKFRCIFLPAVELNDNKIKVAFVLLSYRRERNIEGILRAAVKCKFINHIVVSNNNPDVCIENHISIKDDRISIVNQSKHTGAGNRWSIAKEHAQNFDILVSPDDDVFFYPEQIKRLVLEVLKDPSRVHGIAGAIDHFYVQGNMAEEVDYLYRAYAATSDHVDNYYRLLACLPKNITRIMEENGEDIGISYSAHMPPRIHNLGRILSCKTSLKEGIAINTKPHFMEERLRVFEAVRDKASWHQERNS